MNKITDIFGYISSKQMNLEYIEKILTTGIRQKARYVQSSRY